MNIFLNTIILKIFSNWWTREIPEDTITPIDVLQKRSGLLNDFLKKKKNQSDSDFSQIVRIIAMGTERILGDMNEVIDSMTQEDISETEWKTHPIAVPLINDSRRRTIDLLREAVSEISLVHSRLKQDETMNYIERYSGLQDKIQGLFGQITTEHSTLLSNLQTNVPAFSLESKTLSFIRNSQKVMKNALLKIGAIVSISLLALNLTTTNANENNIETRQSVSGYVNYIIQASWDNPNVTLASAEKEIFVNRTFFRMIDEHPEKIIALAKFENRMKELKDRMIHDPLFASNTYKTGDWMSWNREVAKILIPSVQDITSEEARIITKALQIHLKINNPDSRFGLSTKKALMKYISVKKVEGKQKFAFQEQDLQKELKKVLIWSELILKQILPEHFEEKLMALIGTKYRKGTADCSGILKTVMRKLGVVDKSFDGSSTDIMRMLTTDKRKASEVRSWDFFYWKSIKYPGAHHIAYVSSVEEKGIWIIDSSTDFMSTKKRFLSWTKVLRKKWAIAGTPKFLAQNPSSEKAT